MATEDDLRLMRVPVSLQQASRLCASLALVAAASGCISAKVNTLDTGDCAQAQFVEIEQRLSTTDGWGHGPDVGSAEWQSAVEYLLGVDRNARIPAAGSQAWCQHILGKLR